MSLLPFPKTRAYKVVYADFPWPYYGDPNKDQAAGKHYSLMTEQEVLSFPMRDLFDGHGVLFLWATGPKMDLAYEAIKAWKLYARGIAYVWIKTRKDGKPIAGQGCRPTLVKQMDEYVIGVTTCKTGRPLKILTERQGQNVFAPRGRHSEKPEEVRRRIEELCGDVPRIELFARRRATGWDAWGNQVPEVYPTAPIPMALEGTTEPETWLEPEEMRF